jgi:hypothetical protein
MSVNYSSSAEVEIVRLRYGAHVSHITMKWVKLIRGGEDASLGAIVVDFRMYLDADFHCPIPLCQYPLVTNEQSLFTLPAFWKIWRSSSRR